jgi:tetratricopeptide (TPR) repeat protein
MSYTAPVVAHPLIRDDPAAFSELTRAADDLEAQRPLSAPKLREAAAALKAGQPHVAEHLLSDFLAKYPREPDALHLMAKAKISMQQFGDAAELLSECLEQLPGFEAARFTFAEALVNQNKPDTALEQLKFLLAKHSQSLLYRELKARVLSALGRHAESADCYVKLAEDHPGIAFFRLRYADKLRVLGRRAECIAAYRKVIELCPSLGGAYWSLADLKTFQFTASDIGDMEAQLRRTELSSHNRAYFHFALAKAYADRQLYEKAYEQYARGNALHRIGVDYDPDIFTRYVADCRSLFTRRFFEHRLGFGSNSPAPIFVLGMHRAGSTLIEQILSSHSAIEGIGEAPEIPLLAIRLENEFAPKYDTGYPDVLRLLNSGVLRQFGEEYLESMRLRCKLGRPFFVDKHPSNFWSIGLIQLILPNAKIIDARRHPLACCFSNFTMNFGAGLQHTYRLSDLGRYYVDYARIVSHFDRVLPGKIHRVIYERLVTDTDAEVRRLLDYLGLPFEERSLEFYKTERAVATASSEQVRQPINDEGVGRWRHYEPWLGPLKAALRPILDTYPDVPELDS